MTSTVRSTPHVNSRPLTQRCSGLISLGCLIVLFSAHPAAAQAPEVLRVVEGKSIVLKFPEKVETISLADDEVADVVAITSDEIVVIGKSVGTTSLIVWGESQQHTAYEIKVDRSFSGLQVLLEVQVGEVNRRKLNELGFDFSWINSDDDLVAEGDKWIGVFPGETQRPSIPLEPATGITSVFRFIGDKNQISAAIKALEEQGDLKMLAHPKLLSLSGESATFLSGGQIPVPVPQAGLGFASYTISWKEYGVQLGFVPTVIDSNLINLRITPEVSSLDWANGITLSGFVIPAMLTRRADAVVELNSGQALMLGGLVATESLRTR
jgi:pilus assembly protein CpaC